MEHYLVGGAVRDELLGLTPEEHDYVVVGSTPQEMLDQGFTQVGKDFPVFLHPQTKDEYALARTERKSGPGYTGFTCYAAPDVTLDDDLKRRDLTINAIAKAPDGRLIDPYGGLEDLNQRRLRHISPAFSEDPLRVLRVARFAARFSHFGFQVADETMALMRTMTAQGELNELTAERVWQEISRSLLGPAPATFFAVLAKAGAWPSLFGQALELDLQVLQRLHTKAEQKFRLPALEQRFAVLCNACSVENFTRQQTVDHLSKRWRVSRACSELASLVSLWWPHCIADTFWQAPVITDLLRRSDPIRRDQRWLQVLEVLDFLSHNQPAAADKVALLKRAATAYANTDVKALVEQGLQGAQLAQTIQKCRERAVDEVFSDASGTER